MARRSQSEMRAPRRGQPQGLPLQIQRRRARSGGWGFFRVIPFSNVVLDSLRRRQGKIVRILRCGSLRKNRPRAERRRSFWPFFFGEKEKGRKNNKINKKGGK